MTEDVESEVYYYENVPWQLALEACRWWRKNDLKDLPHEGLTTFYLWGVDVWAL